LNSNVWFAILFILIPYRSIINKKLSGFYLY
jgi:hypothetical protein